MKTLMVLCLALTGCHKPPTSLNHHILPQCLKIECLASDGCWYDDQAQRIHRERVIVTCVAVQK